MVALCKELFGGEHERQRLREEQGETSMPNPFLVHTRTMKGKCTLRFMLDIHAAGTDGGELCLEPEYHSLPISITPRWITTYHALILYWTGADKKVLQVKIFLLTEGEDYMAFCQATEGEKAPPLPHV